MINKEIVDIFAKGALHFSFLMEGQKCVFLPVNKQVKEMIENDFDLTLYTCTVDGLNRVTVRLNRVK